MRKITLLFALACFIFILSGCGSEKVTNYEKIESNLSKFVQQKKNDNSKKVIFNLSEITDFHWDTLHIFHPYTTVKEIENTLGFKWEAANQTKIIYSDDINLLVFVNEGKVVETIEYPRKSGDFMTESFYQYNPNEATFSVWIQQPNSKIEFHPVIEEK